METPTASMLIYVPNGEINKSAVQLGITQIAVVKHHIWHETSEGRELAFRKYDAVKVTFSFDRSEDIHVITSMDGETISTVYGNELAGHFNNKIHVRKANRKFRARIRYWTGPWED